MTYIFIFLALFIHSIFVIAEYSLQRFKSYTDDQYINKKSFFYKLSLQISSEFEKYEIIILFGKFISIFIYGYFSIELFFSSLEWQSINLSSILLIILKISLIILVLTLFGTLLPRAYAKKNINFSAMVTSLIIRIVYILFYPLYFIIKILFSSLKILFGTKLTDDEIDQNIQDEVKYLIEETSKLSELDDTEKNIITKALGFSEIEVNKIMTERNNISFIDIASTNEEILQQIINEAYSRFPVISGTPDNIIGILNTKDFFKQYVNNNNFDLNNLIREPVFIKENEFIDELLKIMKIKKVHMIIVKDQFNGTCGIVTMEDILEEIVGDIQDEFDEEQKMIEIINDSEYKVNPNIEITKFNELMNSEIPESDDYKSLAGYLLYIEGEIPALHHKIEDNNFIFTILRRSNRKIELIHLKVKPSELLDNDN